jgi:hypothetical protein
MAIQYISALTGVATILFSLLLLYQKRISLDAGAAGAGVGGAAAIDADFKLFKVSSRVPAIALFLIGLILIAVPSLKGSERARSYSVIGSVQADGGSPLNEVEVVPRYPPLHLTGGGKIEGLKVWRDPDGRLPMVNLSHSDYASEPIDLNDAEQVSVDGDFIRLKKPLTLHKIGGAK